VHDHSHERRIFDKSTSEKLKAIRLFRAEGNEHFKTKSYDEAVLSYKRAMLYLDYSFAENDSEDMELDTERLKCHINLAAAYIEIEMFDEAVNQCRLALKIDPDCVKAHFRMGLAHLKKGELENAQISLYAALKRGSSQGRETINVIEAAIRELNVKMREYRRRSADIAKAALKS